MKQPSVPQGTACPHAGSYSPSSHCQEHAVGSLHTPAPHPLCRGGHHNPTTMQELFPTRCKNKQGFGSHVSTTRCGTTSFHGRGKPCYLLCISHWLHDAHEPNAPNCVRVCSKPSTRPMVPYPLQADLLQLSPPRPSTHCRQSPGHPAAPRTFLALPGARPRGKVTVLQVSTHTVPVFSWTPIRGCVSSECLCCQLQTSIASDPSQHRLPPACKTPRERWHCWVHTSPHPEAHRRHSLIAGREGKKEMKGETFQQARGEHQHPLYRQEGASLPDLARSHPRVIRGCQLPPAAGSASANPQKAREGHHLPAQGFYSPSSSLLLSPFALAQSKEDERAERQEGRRGGAGQPVFKPPTLQLPRGGVGRAFPSYSTLHHQSCGEMLSAGSAGAWAQLSLQASLAA